MRIASYNIRKAVGLDWRRDPERIMRVLDEIDADVIALQEADIRTGGRAGVLPLDRMLEEHGYQLADVAVRPDSHGWHGNVLFVRNPYLITESRRINLPSLEPRGAVSALLEQPKIEIVGVHLALDPVTRRRQIARLASDLRAKPHATIVAGDFNQWSPRKTSLTPLGQVVSPGFSFHASRPLAALDKFVVSGLSGMHKAWVHQTPSTRTASDHLPIVMDVSLDGLDATP
ncbi:MAG: endonuclease/exonuclease/phosphatase family protein [Loktanella sp.]|nr:endonuclease/exonuclease/phosphatase family protein [Loktanella sp.]